MTKQLVWRSPVAIQPVKQAADGIGSVQESYLVSKNGINKAEELVGTDVVAAAAAGIPDCLIPPGPVHRGEEGTKPADALPRGHARRHKPCMHQDVDM